jgi:hypothetical protein
MAVDTTENSWQAFGATFKEIRQHHEQADAGARERIRQAWQSLDPKPNPKELALSDHRSNVGSREAVAAEAARPLLDQEVTAGDIGRWEKNDRPGKEHFRALENALIYHNPLISNPSAESDHLEKAYHERAPDFSTMLAKYRGSLTTQELAELVNHCPDHELAPGEKRRLTQEGTAFLEEVEEGKVRPSDDMAWLLKKGLVKHLEAHAQWLTRDENIKLEKAYRQLERHYDDRLDGPDDADMLLKRWGKKLGDSLLPAQMQRDTTRNLQAEYDQHVASRNAEAAEGKLWNELRTEYRKRLRDEREKAEDSWIEQEMQRRREGGNPYNIADIKQRMRALFIIDERHGLNVNHIAQETHHRWNTINDVFNPEITKPHFHIWAKLAAYVEGHGRSLDDYIRLTRECNRALKSPADSRPLYDVKTALAAVCKGKSETYPSMSKETGLNDTHLAKILSPRNKDNHFELWAELADYLGKHSKTPEQSIREFAKVTIELDKALQHEKPTRDSALDPTS